MLRLQLAFQAQGRFRRARLISKLNLRLTGAEFVVGCRAGSGLLLPHPQGIVVGTGAEVGEDCTILQHVTIGERYGDGSEDPRAYPRVGDRVTIGAGAVVLGGITVGHDAVIGANAVVVRDVATGDVVGGVPARSIR
jgi:serine O-acetyltransferase